MAFKEVSAVISLILLSGCVTDKSGAFEDKGFVRDTNSGTSVLRLSRSAAAAGDSASAINVLKQGIMANPKAPDLYIELAEKYIKDGKPTEAIKVLEMGEKNNPDSYHIIRKLGNAYLMVEQPEKALVVFDKGLEITKDDPLLHSSKGIALDLLSRTEDARREYETSLKISNENINALNNLAMSHVLSSDLPKAKEILEKIAFSRTAPVQVRQNLAFVYAMMGENDKAKQVGLRDFSESEVKENIEFYRQLSGFMVSDGTSAKVSPVVAGDIAAKPADEKQVAAKPQKPDALPAAESELAENAETQKNAKKQNNKLFGLEIEPAKVEEKTTGTVMNAPLPEQNKHSAADAEVAPKAAAKEVVDEKTIFPWLTKNQPEPQKQQVSENKTAANEVKIEAPKVAEVSGKKSGEIELAQTLSSLAPGSGVAGQAVPAATETASEKADSIDRKSIFSSKASKKYFLQLGEYPSEDAAKKNWEDVSEKVSVLRNYKFMFIDSSQGSKKVVIGPFNYGEQYSSIAKELEGKKVTYKVIEQ